MRKVRVKNLTPAELVQFVTTLTSDEMLLVSKELHSELIKETIRCASSAGENEMGFTADYGDEKITTVVKFKKFCDQYYRVDEVRVDGKIIYGYSHWKYTGKQVAMSAG